MSSLQQRRWLLTGDTASSPGWPPVRRGWRALAWLAWGYLAAVLGAWLLLAAWGDRWWPATLLLYGPRWPLALPLLLLAPAAALWRRRALAPLLVAAAVVLVPVMGFCVPYRAAFGGDGQGFRLRVLTCNVDGPRLNAAALSALVVETKPDVVALQEWSEDNSPAVFAQEGWHVAPGRNGVHLASRYPMQVVGAVTNEPGWWDLIVRCDLETPAGAVHFFNLHLATPRDGLEEVRARAWRGGPALEANTRAREQESAAARRLVDQAGGPVVLAGDFNLPADSAIYRRHWGAFTDGFAAAGWGFGYTKRTRWNGVRIDHVLAGDGWRFRRCWVGPNVGSDHLPLLADLELAGVAD